MQDDAQNEVKQEVPQVPTVPLVSAETELLLKHMATAMAGAFQAQQQQQQATVAPNLSETSFTLREFYKFNPPVFSGETDPLIAEDWLEQITQILDSMPVEDETVRIRLATF